MKHLLPLVTEENKRLYWAFGLVAGFWSISLVISAVITLVGGRPVTFLSGAPESAQPEVTLTPAGTESMFRSRLSAQSPDTQVSIEQLVSYDFTTLTASLPGELDSIPAPVSDRLIATGDATLLTFADSMLTSYSLAEPKKPQLTWQHQLPSSAELIDVRSTAGSYRLAVRLPITADSPCPIPVITGASPLNIDCKAVLLWNQPMTLDSVTILLSLDGTTGSLQSSSAWLGNAATTTLITDSAVYTAASTLVSADQLLPNFLENATTSLIDAAASKKIQDISKLKISQSAKVVAYHAVLAEYSNRFSDLERLQWQTSFIDQFTAFARQHPLPRTVLTALDLPSLTPTESQIIPGLQVPASRLHFSDDRIQILTQTAESRYALYRLSSELEIEDVLQDISPGNRVVSAAWIADDVLLRTGDNSVAASLIQNKTLRTLPLPGNTIYAYAIEQGKKLAIQPDNSDSKLTVVDTDIVPLIVDEYWSDTAPSLDTAVYDPESKLFFMTGAAAGYFISVDETKLELAARLPHLKRSMGKPIKSVWYMLTADNDLIAIDAPVRQR